MKNYVSCYLEIALEADKPVKFKNINFAGQVTVKTDDVDLFLESFKKCSFRRLIIEGSQNNPLILKANHFKNVEIETLILKDVQSIDENFLKGKTLDDLTIKILNKNPVPLPKKLFKTTTIRSLEIYGAFKKRSQLIPISHGFLNGVKDIERICISNAKFENEFMTKARAHSVVLNHCSLNTNMFKHTTSYYLGIDGKVSSKMFNTIKITGVLSIPDSTSIDKNFLKETFKENEDLTLYLGTWNSLNDFKELDGKTLNFLTFMKVVNASEDHLVGTNVKTLNVHKIESGARNAFTKTNFASFARYDSFRPGELDIAEDGYDNGTTVYLDHFYTAYTSKKTINNITFYKLNHSRHSSMGYAVTTVVSGDRFSSHGRTLNSAMEGLINKTSFRTFHERLLTKYKLNQLFTKEEAVSMYREVTGACAAGTNYFLETGNYPTKDTYTFSEIAAYTRGQYGDNRLLQFIKALSTFEPDKARAQLEPFENALKEAEQWED